MPRHESKKPVSQPLGLGGLLSRAGELLRPGKTASGPAATPQRNPQLPAAAWSLQVFDDIEWKRFETLCAQLFAQAGFEARTQSHGADGGVDIWLHSRNAAGPVAVVQCKHWLTRTVGAKEVIGLLRVMAAHKVSRGTLVTTSRFSDDAEQLARDNGIHLLDVHGLLKLIAKRTPEQQQALLQHAYEGEYWRPTCASCGLKMVERPAREGRSASWGCAAYPDCRFTLPLKVRA